MYISKMRAILLGFALLAATSVLAQKAAAPRNNEVGLVVGATVRPSISNSAGETINLNPSLALGAEYDRRLLGERTILYGGADCIASPADVKVSYPPSDVSPEYAYLFLSHHVKVKFNATRALQPWLSFGGGYADFSPVQPRASNINVKGHGNSGTLEFGGGGLDTRPLIQFKEIPLLRSLPIGGRFEARDFYSGQPDFGAGTGDSRQNNVVLPGAVASLLKEISLRR